MVKIRLRNKLLEDVIGVSKNSSLALHGANQGHSINVFMTDGIVVIYLENTKKNLYCNMGNMKTYINKALAMLMSSYPGIKPYASLLKMYFTTINNTMATDHENIFINPVFLVHLHTVFNNGDQNGVIALEKNENETDDEFSKRCDIEFAKPIISADYGTCFVLLHEIYHNMLHHFEREKIFERKYTSPTTHDHENIAEDQEVNSLIIAYAFENGFEFIEKIKGILYRQGSPSGKPMDLDSQQQDLFYTVKSVPVIDAVQDPNDPSEQIYQVAKDAKGNTAMITKLFPNLTWEKVYKYLDDHDMWTEGFTTGSLDFDNNNNENKDENKGNQSIYDQGYFDGYRENAENQIYNMFYPEYSKGYVDGKKAKAYDVTNDTDVNDPDYLSGKDSVKENNNINFINIINEDYDSYREGVDLFQFAVNNYLTEKFKIVDKNSKAYLHGVAAGRKIYGSNPKNSSDNIIRRNQDADKTATGNDFNDNGENNSPEGGANGPKMPNNNAGGSNGDQKRDKQAGNGAKGNSQPQQNISNKNGKSSGQGNSQQNSAEANSDDNITNLPGNKQDQSQGEGQSREGQLDQSQGKGQQPQQGEQPGEGQSGEDQSGQQNGQQGEGQPQGNYKNNGNQEGQEGQLGNQKETGHYKRHQLVDKNGNPVKDDNNSNTSDQSSQGNGTAKKPYNGGSFKDGKDCFDWNKQRDILSPEESEKMREELNIKNHNNNLSGTWKRTTVKYGLDGTMLGKDNPLIKQAEGKDYISNKSKEGANSYGQMGLEAINSSIEESMKSYVDWKNLLRKYIRGAFHAPYRHLNKHHLAITDDYIEQKWEPRGGKSMGNILFLVDESGSVGTDMLAVFFKEIRSLYYEMHSIKNVIVFPFAGPAYKYYANVYKRGLIESPLKEEVDGGTDPRSAMEAMLAGEIYDKTTSQKIWNDERSSSFPVVTIILTDGEFPMEDPAKYGWDVNKHKIITFIIGEGDFINQWKEFSYKYLNPNSFIGISPEDL